MASKTTEHKRDTTYRYQGAIADWLTSQVHFYDGAGHVHQTWRLIPARVEGVFTPSQSGSLGSLPPYGEDATGQSSTHTHHAESEGDDFGTIVTEVTTSTITTRKRYRVQDA